MISLNRTHPGAGEVTVWLELDGSMFILCIIGDDEGRVDVVFEDALEIADWKCLKILHRFSSLFDSQICKAFAAESIDKSSGYCDTISARSLCR